MCPTADLSLLTDVVDIICLAVLSVPAVSYPRTVHLPVGVLEGAMEKYKFFRNFESQGTPKDAKIAARVIEVDNVERCIIILGQ